MIEHAAEGRGAGHVRPTESAAATATNGDALSDVLLDQIRLDEPIVRTELVLAARARLAEGHRPSDDDLALLLLEELVGDRLR